MENLPRYTAMVTVAGWLHEGDALAFAQSVKDRLTVYLPDDMTVTATAMPETTPSVVTGQAADLLDGD